MMAIDLSKEQTLDLDPKAILKIDFTGSLGRDGNPTMFFIIEEEKESILNHEEMWEYCSFIFI